MIKIKLIKTLLLLTCFAASNVVQAETNMSLGTVNALTINPADPGSMLAATDEGVWSFKEGNWKEFTSPEGDITDMANTLFNKDIIYMVTRDGKLHKSRNMGRNYELVDVNVNGIRYSIRTVTTHYLNADEVIVGSTDGYVIHSTNGGKSWRVVNVDFPFTTINSIAFDPTDTNIIYVGTGGNGVLKTTDSGNSWNRMNEGLSDLTITRIVSDTRDRSILYAGTYGGGVFKSVNQGESWTEINQGLTDTFVYSLAISPAKSSNNPDIYVGVFGGDIYRSATNGEINWEKL